MSESFRRIHFLCCSVVSCRLVRSPCGVHVGCGYGNNRLGGSTRSIRDPDFVDDEHFIMKWHDTVRYFGLFSSLRWSGVRFVLLEYSTLHRKVHICTVQYANVMHTVSYWCSTALVLASTYRFYSTTLCSISTAFDCWCLRVDWVRSIRLTTHRYLLSMPLDGLECSVSVGLTPRCDYLSPVENLVIAMLEHASPRGIRTKDTSRVLPERLFLIRAYTSNILKL